MKKSKLLVVSGVALATLFTVVGCGGGETAEERVNRVASEVKVGCAAFKDGIKNNQQLQSLVDGVTVTYTETSDRLTVSADGKTLEVTVPYLGDKITVDGTEVTVDDTWYETAVIVATFSYKGVTVTKNIHVMLIAAANVMSFDQYIAAATDTAACVQIVVDRVGMERRYNYVLVWGHDAQGNGYYVYNAGDKNLGKLEPGNEVILSGTKDIYNGYHELKKVDSCTLVSEGNAVVSTPKDITSTLAAATDMAASNLVQLQGSLVKATGLIVTDVRAGKWVEGTDGAESYGEKYFIDVVAANGGPEFTIGICRSADDFTDLWATLGTIKVDDVITVEGYASWFNVFNITLVGNDVTVTGTVTKTNQEKVDASKAAIESELPSAAGASLTLPTTGLYDGVTVAWTSSNTSAISVGANGVCTVTGAATEQTVTLTGVVSIAGGTETATISHTITVPAVSNSTILNARNGYGGSDQAGITVEGQVTAVQGSSFYIDDGISSIFIYNYGNNHGFVVGDSVTVTGTLTSYSGLMQIKSKTAGGKLTDKTYTARSAVTLTEAEFTKENLTGQDGRIVKLENLTFVEIKKAWASGSSGTTAQYIFKLGNTNITLTLNKFATNGAGVKDIIEALTAGDVIDVTAPMGWYNGPQVDLTNASEITVK